MTAIIMNGRNERGRFRLGPFFVDHLSDFEIQIGLSLLGIRQFFNVVLDATIIAMIRHFPIRSAP